MAKQTWPLAVKMPRIMPCRYGSSSGVSSSRIAGSFPPSSSASYLMPPAASCMTFAGDEIDDPGREMLGHDPDHFRERQRAERRRLDHGRVAHDQRRRETAKAEDDRKVPGRNDRCHATRFLHHQEFPLLGFER